tara:strand:+ start:2183 stop:2866 length:684 start_codon:yes stop_codon:yes gene_type:complete
MSGVVGPRKSVIYDGLIFYVDAYNKNSISTGETIWKDLIQSNNGTLTNGATYVNVNGGAISFDGVDDFVDFLGFNAISELGNGGPTTISCWFKPLVLGQRMLVACPGVPRYYIECFNRGGTLVAHWGFGAQQNSGTSQAILSLNNIYNYLVTYDGTNILSYLNGSLTDTVNIGSQSYNNSNLRIGKYTNLSPLNFNGDIYQTLIYNRALSSSEVLINYNAIKSRFNV